MIRWKKIGGSVYVVKTEATPGAATFKGPKQGKKSRQESIRHTRDGYGDFRVSTRKSWRTSSASRLSSSLFYSSLKGDRRVRSEKIGTF